MSGLSAELRSSGFNMMDCRQKFRVGHAENHTARWVATEQIPCTETRLTGLRGKKAADGIALRTEVDVKWNFVAVPDN